jgi:hypothetical protein
LQTELTEQRMKVILDRLGSHRFILRTEVRTLIKVGA